MEKLSVESQVFLRPVVFIFYSICLISEDRMTDICHVDTDLVCPTCFECHFEETECFSFIVKCFHDFVVCDRFPSFHGVFYRHSESIIWIASYDGLNSSECIPGFSYDEREICLLDCMVMYEFLEFTKCCIILCDEEKSTCILI